MKSYQEKANLMEGGKTI